MNKSVVVGVLVKNSDGKYLLVKKPDGVGPYAGTYLTPGGHVDDVERIDDAARRELYEETGVRVNNLKRVYFDDDITGNWKGDTTHFIMLMYTGDYRSGNLQATAGDDDNLEVIRWFSVEEIKKLPLCPPVKTILHFLNIL